jgi:hypothetical protein
MKKTQVKKTSSRETAKYIFLWSSAYFTAITLILLISQALETDTYVAPLKFLLIYPFALVMALGNLVIKAPSLKLGTKTLLHCAMTIGSAYLFLILPSKGSANALMVLAAFAVIYFVVATPILITKKRKLKKAEEEAPYKPMFTKQK